MTGTETAPEMINKLGCPLCHTIPGVEGAVGELGAKVHEKIKGPKCLLDLELPDLSLESAATQQAVFWWTISDKGLPCQFRIKAIA